MDCRAHLAPGPLEVDMDRPHTTRRPLGPAPTDSVTSGPHATTSLFVLRLPSGRNPPAAWSESTHTTPGPQCPGHLGDRDVEVPQEADELSARSAPSVIDSLKRRDRKSTRLNSSHSSISYAVFCLKKKKKINADFSSTTQIKFKHYMVH